MPQNKPPAANPVSTSFAKARFAHPFFVPAPPAARQPVNGQTRMTDWSKLQLGPLPAVARGGKMDLSEIIGAAGVKEIQDLGEIRFHALGDTGVSTAHEAQLVAEEMATDFNPSAGGLNPAFLFHLATSFMETIKPATTASVSIHPTNTIPAKLSPFPEITMEK